MPLQFENYNAAVKWGATVEFKVNEDDTTGEILDLYQNSATPAANDFVGLIRLDGNNNTGARVTYASINGIIDDPAGADGSIRFRVLENGVLGDSVVFDDNGSGIKQITVGFTSGGRVKAGGTGSLFLSAGASTNGVVIETNQFNTSNEVQTGPGALSTLTYSTEITTTGVGDALTLANGANGQHKVIVYVAEGAGADTAILTPTNLAGTATTITFNNIGDSVHLFYRSGAWHIVGIHGAVVA